MVFVLLLTEPEISQATAGEEEDDEEEGCEDEDINVEKEKAYLMHATSGSGMHAIEVWHPGDWCSLFKTYVSIMIRCPAHVSWLRQQHAFQAKHDNRNSASSQVTGLVVSQHQPIVRRTQEILSTLSLWPHHIACGDLNSCRSCCIGCECQANPQPNSMIHW